MTAFGRLRLLRPLASLALSDSAIAPRPLLPPRSPQIQASPLAAFAPTPPQDHSAGHGFKFGPPELRIKSAGRPVEASRMEVKMSSAPDKFEEIEIERKGAVGVVTLNRPKSLNALCTSLMEEVVTGMEMLDEDKDTKVIILVGSGKHFCAGADIKEMQMWSYSDAYNGRKLSHWRRLEALKTPLIAAVHGVAFGGGCELAMLCDILVASQDASFSQPEVKLGIIPGMGGTQRLVRAVGKSKAMEMILTGTYRMGAEEACQRGLVSKVVPREELLPEAMKIAEDIAKLSAPVISKAKDCVNAAYRMTLPDALHHEQREFWSCFALQDGQAGLKAFVDKQTPEFKDC